MKTRAFDYLDRSAKLPTATEFICFLAIASLVFVSCLAMDQRNIMRRKDARIQELCDLCNYLTLENVDLKRAAKK